MFDYTQDMTPLLDDLRGLTATLVEGRVDPGDHDVAADAVRVESIAALERLKSAACAAQADLAVGLDASVREQHAVAGVAAARRGRGVGAQVALARSESPHRGQVLLGFAKDLATDLPHTRQALREGVLNEYRAVLVARETGCLDREDRAPPRRGAVRTPPRRRPPQGRGTSAPPGWSASYAAAATPSTPPASCAATAAPRPSAGSASAPPPTRWPT